MSVIVNKLQHMTRGWFVGNFKPVVHKTEDVEVAIQHFEKGDKEPRHVHKIATEITTIVSGRVRMNGVEYEKGDIIKIPAGEPTDFEALEDAVTCVVKHPGALNDKYVLSDE